MAKIDERKKGAAGSGAGDMTKAVYDAANVSEQLVGTTATQTLTNKTLTGHNETQQTLTDAANIDWNMNSGKHAQVTLTANRIMNAPTNLKVGYCTLMVIQDAGGTNTLDLSAAVFKFPAGVEPTMSTGGNAIDIISFYCDGTSLHGITNYLFS